MSEAKTKTIEANDTRKKEKTIQEEDGKHGRQQKKTVEEAPRTRRQKGRFEKTKMKTRSCRKKIREDARRNAEPQQ